MSVDILDYLPCDLVFYSQQLLPAWLAARKGQFEPLREIIARHYQTLEKLETEILATSTMLPSAAGE